ncbi:hypothetical protein CGCSCA1_v012758 [Colletotrichum siamense]|nr:hypothetical protein CGCSCA1_v012758 [Colletotrichum siamense]
MSKTLQTDILAVLQQLGSDWNLFKHPVPSDHPAIKDLDSLLDPGRKNAILRFPSALQQLGNIVTEEEDLPILVALGFTGFEQIAYTPSAVFARMLSTHSFDQGRHQQSLMEILRKTEMINRLPSALAKIRRASSATLTRWAARTVAPSPVRQHILWTFWGCSGIGLLLPMCLLGLLRNRPATANVTIPLPPFDGSVINTGSVPRGSILDKLFNRRPDLGDLLVSCHNTNEVVPYIDLVNEVLESALRYLQTNNNKLEKRGMRISAHNANKVEKDTQDGSDYDAAYYPSGSIESSSSANKAALLSDAANIDHALYNSVIVPKLAPSFIFPYDHFQDSLERHLAASKTNLPEMASVFQPFAKSNGSSRVVIARANASQTLGMSHADFLSLTTESYFDLQLATIETGNLPLQVDEYRKLCDKDADAGDGEFDILQNGSQEPVAPDDQVGVAFIKIQLLPRMEGQSLTSLFKILKTDSMFNCLVISVGLQSNTARKASGNIAMQLEGARLCGKNEEDAGTW